MRWLLAIVIAVGQTVLGFSAPSAEGVETGPETIRVRVEVTADPGLPVVVHLVAPGDEQMTVSMVEREPGVYVAEREVRPVDWVVVFEALTLDPFQSDPHRLTELGLSRDVLGVGPPAGGSDGMVIDEQTRDWGWLGLAAGALSLSLLAFWTLGGGEGSERRRGRASPTPVDPGSEPD